MNRTDTLQYQQSVRTFANIETWQTPFAVTLTLRQSRQTDPGRHVRLTREIASANFRHFMNILNKQVLGKAYTRFSQQLRVIAVLEGGDDKRLHYHAVIECPGDEQLLRFPALIQKSWLRTDWGFQHSNIQIDADNGWINYISKLRDKPSYVDAFDWANCYNVN